MKVTHTYAMPVIGPNGRSVRRRVLRKDGTFEMAYVRAPTIFTIDLCERCGIGSGTTFYGGRPFTHRSRTLVKADWLERSEKDGWVRERKASDLCEECLQEVHKEETATVNRIVEGKPSDRYRRLRRLVLKSVLAETADKIVTIVRPSGKEDRP